MPEPSDLQLTNNSDSVATIPGSEQVLYSVVVVVDVVVVVLGVVVVVLGVVLVVVGVVVVVVGVVLVVLVEEVVVLVVVVVVLGVVLAVVLVVLGMLLTVVKVVGRFVGVFDSVKSLVVGFVKVSSVVDRDVLEDVAPAVVVKVSKGSVVNVPVSDVVDNC